MIKSLFQAGEYFHSPSDPTPCLSPASTRVYQVNTIPNAKTYTWAYPQGWSRSNSSPPDARRNYTEVNFNGIAQAECY